MPGYAKMALVVPCVAVLAQQLSNKKSSGISKAASAFYQEYPRLHRELTKEESALLAEAFAKVLDSRESCTGVLCEAVQAATYALEQDGGKGGPFKAELLRINAHKRLAEIAHNHLDKSSSEYTGSSAKNKAYKDALFLQARSAHALRGAATAATKKEREVCTI